MTWKRILIDVCTQNDYLEPGAIQQVNNRQALIPHLRRIFEWAKHTGVPVVSVIESHRPTEPLNGIALHCIDGTYGQSKPEYTQLEPRLLIEADNTLALPPDITRDYRQLLFRKRARDVLGNPKTDRFLTQMAAQEFILFGVGLERTIRGLALGLLARHKSVTVVSDACGLWSPAEGDLTLRQLAAKHIKLITTEALIAPPSPAPPRQIIYHGRVLRRYHPERLTGGSNHRRVGKP